MKQPAFPLAWINLAFFCLAGLGLYPAVLIAHFWFYAQENSENHIKCWGVNLVICLSAALLLCFQNQYILKNEKKNEW